ncbi:MAG: BamA/TamA family outer membrane protein, partial [Gemmatimonadota bacterium]
FDPLPFGAAERTRFARASAGVALEFTHRAGFQERGARFGVAGDLYRGVDDTPSDFHRLEGEAVGYLPLNPRQLLAVRAFAAATRLDDGQGIPFFHLSRVGGRAGLRGFSTDRFRDRDAVGVMAEWRYEVWRDLHQRSRAEFFLFFDEAGVTSSLGDLSGSDLRASYGFGLRFVTVEGLFGYASIGFGEEGARFRLGDAWTF